MLKLRNIAILSLAAVAQVLAAFLLAKSTAFGPFVWIIYGASCVAVLVLVAVWLFLNAGLRP